MKYQIERRRNVVTIEEFDLEHQPHQMLLFIVRECRERWERRYSTGQECRAIEALMNVASAELFRRRLGHQLP